MSPRLRALGFIAAFLVSLAAETVLFASRGAAGLLRLRGERAFFRNDPASAMGAYEKALSLGGDPAVLETDIIELLLFGLDQVDAGIAVDAPMPPAEALARAQALVERRLEAQPYRAYLWSLASDIYLKQGTERRRRATLDLSTLAEEPLENLLEEERRGLAALDRSTRLEPNNYIYPSLIAEQFIELGAVREAALYCRRAVRAYPVLGAHRYLTRPDVAPEVIDAALQGFVDARTGPSLVPGAVIVADAGRLLVHHGRRREALPRLAEAVALEPTSYEAWFDTGLAHFGLEEYAEAIACFEKSEALLPEVPWPSFYIGLSYAALGRDYPAIAAFRRTKDKQPGDVAFAHKLAESLEKVGAWDEAERQLVAAAHLNPGNDTAWSRLLGYYLGRSDARAARRVCAQRRGAPVAGGAFEGACARLEASLGTGLP